MHLIKLLRLRFTEAGWLCFTVLGIIPSILFRSWGNAILYYVAVLFIWVWLEVIARRATQTPRDFS